MNKSNLVICIVGLVCASPAIGGTLNVPADYPTIQAAIDAAVDGDTVLVAAGTYYENLMWKTKSIGLINVGAGATIVDGGGGGTCLYMYHVPDTAVVEGFTFTGGSAEYGGGIYNQSSSPTFRDCTFTGNSAQAGGGMSNWQSSPILTNCTFSGNSANDSGGGDGQPCQQ